jgi:hypothetical protein
MFSFNNTVTDKNKPFINRIAQYNTVPINILDSIQREKNEGSHIINYIDVKNIMNIKETRSFPLLESREVIPKDIFNIICDGIIDEITTPKKIVMTVFRDKLYDILTYNLDINECLWYILTHFIENNENPNQQLEPKSISDILIKTYSFFKFFNNNYRPIFHLESIMYYIINKIHKLG